MPETATVARPYARAAFAQAQEEGQLAEWSRALGLLAQIVADRQMRFLIGDPRLGQQRLERLLLDIMPMPLSQTMRDFIHVLIQAGRLNVVPALHILFERRRAVAESTVSVQVRTAFPLQRVQQDALRAALGRRFGRRAQLQVEVDETLISGVVIRAGDTVIDASMCNSLHRLRKLFAS